MVRSQHSWPFFPGSNAKIQTSIIMVQLCPVTLQCETQYMGTVKLNRCHGSCFICLCKCDCVGVVPTVPAIYSKHRYSSVYTALQVTRSSRQSGYTPGKSAAQGTV